MAKKKVTSETEWLNCTDPVPMLMYLGSKRREKGRKPRLFGAACCRRIWHLLVDSRSQEAVEASEQYADRLLPKALLIPAERRAHQAISDAPPVQAMAADAAWRVAG